MTRFPERGGPKTLRQAKSEFEALLRLGTAKDKKETRILDVPQLGPDAFAQAYVLSGVPGGTIESIDAYTQKWHLTLTYPTSQLLAQHEITTAVRLLRTLPH